MTGVQTCALPISGSNDGADLRQERAGIPGIAFLSGGQSEEEAAKNLNSINLINDTNFIMTYSYGRALQQSALKFWSKDISNIKGTQDTFNHRAKMCSLAAQGKWSEDIEKK